MTPERLNFINISIYFHPHRLLYIDLYEAQCGNRTNKVSHFVILRQHSGGVKNLFVLLNTSQKFARNWREIGDGKTSLTFILCEWSVRKILLNTCQLSPDDFRPGLGVFSKRFKHGVRWCFHYGNIKSLARTLGYTLPVYRWP